MRALHHDSLALDDILGAGDGAFCGQFVLLVDVASCHIRPMKTQEAIIKTFGW